MGWIIFLIGFGSAAVYLGFGRKGAESTRLVLSSLYGPVISMMFLIPLHPSTDGGQFEKTPLLIAQLLPLGLIIYSLARYPGRGYVHLLMPLNVIVWVGYIVMLEWL